LFYIKIGLVSQSSGISHDHHFDRGAVLETAMQLPRRQFLHLAARAAAIPGLSRIAAAQIYPSRPIRLIVGFPAGGTGDILARLMSQWLSERLRQPCIIENRPGAGTNIAAEVVVKSTADGYTLLLVVPANAINATLYENLNFNFIRDIAPIVGFARVPFVMEVNRSVPVTTVPEFIAYAKANPGKINMGSSGNGTTPHVTGELFKMMTGVDMVHVPYRGETPALTDLIDGQVQVYFGTLPGSIEHIRAGRLRALAVTTTTRTEALPDVPTVSDFVPGYEASGWLGLGAPRHTPSEIIDSLNREINAALVDPKIRARLANLGATVLALSPSDFGKLITDETQKWARVVKFSGAKAG
jgi:tripartite-type tricarboxylate transporter receptor subunit TctC